MGAGPGLQSLVPTHGAPAPQAVRARVLAALLVLAHLVFAWHLPEHQLSVDPDHAGVCIATACVAGGPVPPVSAVLPLPAVRPAEPILAGDESLRGGSDAAPFRSRAPPNFLPA